MFTTLKTREATREDYPKLVEFWNKNSEWDQIDIRTWENRFIDTPYGSVIVIAEHNGKIVSQLVYILNEIKLGNRIVKGSRPFAAIVEKSIKSITGFVQLFKFGSDLLRQKQIALLAMLPNPKWKVLTRFIDIQIGNFPLYKKLIEGDHNLIEGDIINTKYIDFDDRGIEDLWESVNKRQVYMIKKDRQSLKWKNSHRDYKLIGCYQQGKLIGIATFLEKMHEKQIQICDLLYESEDIKEHVLSSVSNFINSQYCAIESYKKMVILVPEALKGSLVSIGYEPDDYQFLFVVKILNKDLLEEEISMSDWYLSAND